MGGLPRRRGRFEGVDTVCGSTTWCISMMSGYRTRMGGFLVWFGHIHAWNGLHCIWFEVGHFVCDYHFTRFTLTVL
jgi:hypothetical protein